MYIRQQEKRIGLYESVDDAVRIPTRQAEVPVREIVTVDCIEFENLFGRPSEVRGSLTVPVVSGAQKYAGVRW